MAARIAEEIGQGHKPFAAAIIIYFSIIGFMGSYLLTRLWLAPAFARSDVEAASIRDLLLAKAFAATSNLNFSAALYSEASARPRANTPEVGEVTKFKLGELNSPEDVETWAKAQLSSGNYEQAINGYSKLITLKPDDINVRLDYAAALYYAHRPRETSIEQLVEAYGLMKSDSSGIDERLKMKIYRAITYQSLYIAPPQGYEATIKYGKEYVVEHGEQGMEAGIAVNLACAYGQKYKYLQDHSGSPNDLNQARDKSLHYVRIGAQGGEGWRDRLRQLLVKNYPNKHPDDDDLEVFESDKDFKDALGLT